MLRRGADVNSESSNLLLNHLLNRHPLTQKARKILTAQTFRRPPVVASTLLTGSVKQFCGDRFSPYQSLFFKQTICIQQSLCVHRMELACTD